MVYLRGEKDKLLINKKPKVMMKLNNPKFYKEHEDLYNVLSDYIFEDHNSVSDSVVEGVRHDVYIGDCYLDEEGNLFVPTGYTRTYSGSNEFDDPDEYKASYDTVPTKTKWEVQNMLAQETEKDLLSPANFAN